jgi:FkbM family methyltransferase
MLEGHGAGFYVDVGAHHPDRFSNTRLLRDRGWRGINIDGTPGSMEAFRRARPDDINVEAIISSDGEPHEFFEFDEPALNSVSRALSTERAAKTDYRIVASTTLPTRTLRDVLDEFLPPRVSIDVMSVDVEGHDFDVLESNDWARFRPRLLLVEVLNTPLSALADSDIVQLLDVHGYELQSKLVNTVVLMDRSKSD